MVFPRFLFFQGVCFVPEWLIDGIVLNSMAAEAGFMKYQQKKTYGARWAQDGYRRYPTKKYTGQKKAYKTRYAR